MSRAVNVDGFPVTTPIVDEGAVLRNALHLLWRGWLDAMRRRVKQSPIGPDTAVTDGHAVVWDGTSGRKVKDGGAVGSIGTVRTADPDPLVDDTWWVLRDGASPETIALKARVAGVTYSIAMVEE